MFQLPSGYSPTGDAQQIASYCIQTQCVIQKSMVLADPIICIVISVHIATVSSTKNY